MNLDQLLRQECLDFIRIAIYKGDPHFAQNLAITIKDICQSGQVDRQQIWADLSSDERRRFRELVAGERSEAVLSRRSRSHFAASDR